MYRLDRKITSADLYGPVVVRSEKSGEIVFCAFIYEFPMCCGLQILGDFDTNIPNHIDAIKFAIDQIRPYVRCLFATHNDKHTDLINILKECGFEEVMKVESNHWTSGMIHVLMLQGDKPGTNPDFIYKPEYATISYTTNNAM